MAHNKISETTVLEILKIEKDEEKQIELVQKAIASVEKQNENTGKAKKATKKNIEGVHGLSPVKILKTALFTLQDSKVENDKVTLLENVVAALMNKESVEHIVDLFT